MIACNALSSPVSAQQPSAARRERLEVTSPRPTPHPIQDRYRRTATGRERSVQETGLWVKALYDRVYGKSKHRHEVEASSGPIPPEELAIWSDERIAARSAKVEREAPEEDG